MTWLRSTGLRLLLAIGLGFALWVFVSHTENPDRVVDFKDRQVTSEGLAPGLVIVDQNGMPNPPLPSVTVTLESDRETLAAPGSSDIHAYVNLSGLGPADHVVPVGARMSLPGRQPDIAEITPPYITIRIDQLITRTVPLTVELMGSAPFSFEADRPIVMAQSEPVTQTQVTGPRNRVERVAYTRATADINGLTAAYNSSRVIEAISADGQVVDGVTIKPSPVNVRVPIRSSVGIKRVPVVPRVVGSPASGYIVTGVSVQPQFVRLTGGSGPLDSIGSVETQDVDVGGARESISRTVSLQSLPFTGVSFGEPVSATVTVQIAPIERPFQVTLPAAIQIADVGAGLLASVNPQVVLVTLSGTATHLAALGSAPLQGMVSARELNGGTHPVTPVFELPQGITLVGERPTVMLTLRLPPSPTAPPTEPPATPTAMPTESPVVAPTETARPTASPGATP